MDAGAGGAGLSLAVHNDICLPYLASLTTEEQRCRWLPGFERGRRLAKLGLHCQDTSELVFTDVPVPRANLLGEVGHGFEYLMANLPQERMQIAVGSLGRARAALAWTADYVRSRTAFGRPVGDFQNTRFVLATWRQR